eukprot:CAMPEP_0203783036 /NCGR_PEP_ID=MMETSP0099_2-20121227/11437_1 /ASSEMBLY_ACC=CAM_ASM_000209 /TAXON_ID=96639 /ORGANISM=" , Strain NY0313808BC1" /LENGTH=215 /DNA_ID=CAMNT_0050684827 /DNA_START=234 /DNA_END=879 /DNA_ORIENTATION=-
MPMHEMTYRKVSHNNTPQMWRSTPSPAILDKAKHIARFGEVDIETCEWGSIVYANVKSTPEADARYSILIQWIDGKLTCMCTCPDKRSGYCKHAAAVIIRAKTREKAPQTKKRKPSWLAAAYSSSASQETSTTTTTGTDDEWIRDVKANQSILNTIDHEQRIDFVSDIIQDDKKAAGVVSQLFGGKDVSSSSYQAMPITRLFDTLAHIKQATTQQ